MSIDHIFKGYNQGTIDEIKMLVADAGYVIVPRKPPDKMISADARIELEYMRRMAPDRGGFMYEGARPAFERGEYKDGALSELLAAKLIAPHDDPEKGWVVIAA